MSFYDAQRAWSARVRTLRYLPAQYLRVAWAIGERFNSLHGVAYASLDDYGALAGGVDRRDVSRAINALASAACIHALDADELQAIIGPALGRPPRGLRMIVGIDADIGDAEGLVIRRPCPNPDMRFSARSARRNSGGAVPPKMPSPNIEGPVPPESMASAASLSDQDFGGPVPIDFRGLCARSIDEILMKGGANSAPPYIQCVDSTVVPEQPAGAPKGAGLTDDELYDADKYFGELFEEERQALSKIKTAIGPLAFNQQLRSVIASGRAVSIAAWGRSVMRTRHAA